MPYKDPAKMAEYMRNRRASKTGKVNVNPLTQNVNPVNPPKKFSQVSGSYEGGNWMGICPVCNHHNRMDPKRSYRPADSCEHYQQLLKPGTASEFLFLRGLTQKLSHTKGVNPLTQNINPVNPLNKSYLLSYSRRKYQFVLYVIDAEGRRSLLRSYSKGQKVLFGDVQVELTWGPDQEITSEVKE